MLLLITLLLSSSVFSLQHTIYWNTSNPLLSGNDEAMLIVAIGDSVRVICPEHNSHHAIDKHLIVYQVSDMSHGECLLESSKKKVIRCDAINNRPEIININSKSPIPNSFTFYPDSRYYWISTSTGSLQHIDNKRGGLCKAKNMRLTIDVIESHPVTTATPVEQTSTTSRAERYKEPEVLKDASEVEPTARRDSYGSPIPKGVDRHHLQQVADMARQGKTGTYPRDDHLSNHLVAPKTSDSSWDPVSLDIWKEMYPSIDGAVYDPANSPVTFIVHEDPPSYTRTYSSYQTAASSYNGLILSFLFLNLLQLL